MHCLVLRKIGLIELTLEAQDLLGSLLTDLVEGTDLRFPGYTDLFLSLVEI